MSTDGLVAGVDIGGTFTDLVLFEPASGRLAVAKVPSTPADQSEGVLNGLRTVLPELSQLARLVHGTTVSTNTMLQGSGAVVAMVTTTGFRDVLEIGRTRRMLPSLYDTRFVRPAPIVARPLRFEVDERLAADGACLRPLDESQVTAAACAIARSGAESVAVCFLHAYVDAVHERRAAALLARQLPGVWVTTSAEVVPEFREYERFSTTVINAYLLPVMDRYLSTLSGRLAAAGYAGKVFTMASGGGVMDLDTARRLPVRTILSGPAGGVAGARWIGAAAGVRNFITCDMGGTSTDVCLVEDLAAASVSETAFAGYPIKGREVAINTVGAGGGSIAFVEAGAQLRVGPRSAGARPGPACYGHGGVEPTVTDANLVLGRLGDRTLGGAIRPDAALAHEAVGRLAADLGVGSVEEMAEGILRIAVAQMASAIREISVERGYDPSEFVLLAFGGAGPMHAVQVADELGMRDVLIPLLPGNLSALGLLASDQRYERVRTRLLRLDAVDTAELGAMLQGHESEGRADLLARGFGPADVRFEHALDMRYARQAFELTVDLPAGATDAATIRRTFLDAYTRHYGRADPDGEIEIVNLRTTCVGVTRKPVVPAVPDAGGTLAGAALGERRLICDGRACEAQTYDRERLPVGVRFDGPAVVEEAGATTVLLPGWHGTRDATGNLRLRRS